MFGLQLKDDDDFYIVIVIVFAIQFFFIWMRMQLKEQGRDYPFMNSSFKIWEDFMYQITINNRLKIKYRKTLIGIIFFVVVFIILILSD